MALKNSKLNGSGNIFVNFNEVEAEKFPPKSNWKEKLDRILNQVWVQTAIVITVLIQLLIVTVLLLIHFKVIQTPSSSSSTVEEGNNNGNHSNDTSKEEDGSDKSHVENVEDVLNAVNIVILILFVIEIFLRLVARGASIIQDKLQIVDGMMVIVVCVTYVGLFVAGSSKSATYIISYLIVFRLWRIGRVYHDITEGERRKAERVINRHRKEAKEAEQYALAIKSKIEEQKHEIASLREQLKIYCPHTKPSPATRSISQQSYTPDDPVTSEDEYDRSDDRTKKVLELVTAELSNGPGHGQTPNGSLPSGTPNSSLPNMTPTSSCSYILGDPEADKISNKFPDLVEQAQGLEVKETTEQVQAISKLAKTNNNNEPKVMKSGYLKNSKERGTVNENVASPTSNDKKCPVGSSGKENTTNTSIKTLSQTGHEQKEDEKIAFSNSGFVPDTEAAKVPAPKDIRRGQDGKTLQTDEMSEIKRISQVPFEELGSSTYLNQDGIPMTDL